MLNRSKDTQAPDACSQRAAAAFGPGGPSFEPASLSAPTAGNASAGEKLSPNDSTGQVTVVNTQPAVWGNSAVWGSSNQNGAEATSVAIYGDKQ